MDHGQPRATRLWRHHRRRLAVHVSDNDVILCNINAPMISYDSCDIGTFPNQTRKDGTPTTNANGGTSKYNYQLSVLSGQKLSSVDFPGLLGFVILLEMLTCLFAQRMHMPRYPHD